MLQGPIPQPQPQPQADGWTPERIARLPGLWADTTVSAAKIAVVLGGGLTRNAVIGKVFRMGLPPRGKSPFAGRPKSGRAVVTAAWKRAAARPEPGPTAGASQPRPRTISLAKPPAAPACAPDDEEPEIAAAPADPCPDAPGVPWPGKPVQCKTLLRRTGHCETWRVCGAPAGCHPSWCDFHASIFFEGARR